MAEIEDLTAENLSLKERNEMLSKQLSESQAQVEGLQNTVVELRTKNANLYMQIGKTSEPTPEPEDELAKKERFQEDYMKSKMNKGV